MLSETPGGILRGLPWVGPVLDQRALNCYKELMQIMWIVVGIWLVCTGGAIAWVLTTARPDVVITKPHCYGCGQVGHLPLRYRNTKSGAHYCSQECVEKDPNWPDDELWICA